jgi:SNF2 family DNA or RNA helicase
MAKSTLLPDPHLNFRWQGWLWRLADDDTTFIPGLRMDEDSVMGTVDALSTYLLRNKGLKLKRKYLQQKNVTPADPRLRPYQNLGVQFILNCWSSVAGCLLADDMGLGKTATTIVAADAAWQDGRSALVVCPGAVRLTWEKEIKAWSKRKDVAIITSSKEAAALVSRPSWVVTSYDLMKSLSTFSPLVTIFDEAHNFAGRDAKRSKRLQELCALSFYRIGLTGTPIWSRPRDYWQLLACLFGSTFGNSWDFDHAYCDAKPGTHGGLDNSGISRAPELRHRVKFYMLRRLKKDVVKEMPALTRTVVHVPPTPSATHEFKSAMLHRRKGAAIKALEATLDAKMEPVMQYAADAKRFLISTWQKKHAYFMAEELNKRGTPTLLITGDLSDKARKLAVEEAVAKKCGIVATIDSTGTGVDGLQHVASIGLMHALDYVPLKLRQMEARLARLGQKDPVQWIYFVMKESMDAHVETTVLNKLDQWGELFGTDEAKDIAHALGGTSKDKSIEDVEREALALIYSEETK